jgi:hypothetical protein
LNLFKERNVEVIRGYFQSYSYVHPIYEKEIRESFTFLPGVQRMARDIVRSARGNSSFIFIGIHVRHGMDVTLHSVNKKESL